MFDIITPSLSDGVEAAMAECLVIVCQVIDAFPGLHNLPLEFRLFHSDCELTMGINFPDLEIFAL